MLLGLGSGMNNISDEELVVLWRKWREPVTRYWIDHFGMRPFVAIAEEEAGMPTKRSRLSRAPHLQGVTPSELQWLTGEPQPGANKYWQHTRGAEKAERCRELPPSTPTSSRAAGSRSSKMT